MRAYFQFALVDILVLSFAAMVLPSSPAKAEDYYVDVATCPGSGSGTLADPYCSIQSGIDDADAGDTVYVASGTYTECISMKSGVVIQGAGQDVTTIDGSNGLVVVTAESVDSTAKLDGFTITGGAGGDFLGGGMDNTNSSPTVSNCTFTGNTAKLGGGMRNQSSSPTVTGCTFSMNSASDYGAGMYNYSSTPTVTGCTFSMNSSDNGAGMYNHSSSPTVTGCTFSENTATNGAGMYNYASSPTVSSCTFSENDAQDYGGGMDNRESSSPMVTNSLFSANVGEYGGGMSNISSSPTVTNCIFSANGNVFQGGGMFNSYSSPTITNCTFSGNEALDGGGIYNEYSTSTTVTNCILWGDAAWGISFEIFGSSIVTYSNIEDGYPGTGNIDQDPLFVGGGDYHLSSGSPCIDAGDNSVPNLPVNDIDGDDRKVDDPEVADTGNGTPPIVDMGVDEYVPEIEPFPWEIFYPAFIKKK